MSCSEEGVGEAKWKADRREFLDQLVGAQSNRGVGVKGVECEI